MVKIMYNNLLLKWFTIAVFEKYCYVRRDLCMSANYISPISMDAISSLCTELVKNNSISKDDFSRYHVKRGLRNEDGTGVMAGRHEFVLLRDIIFLTESLFRKRVSFPIAAMILIRLFQIAKRKTDLDLKK